jgi:hypothetical protein
MSRRVTGGLQMDGHPRRRAARRDDGTELGLQAASLTLSPPWSWHTRDDGMDIGIGPLFLLVAAILVVVVIVVAVLGNRS